MILNRSYAILAISLFVLSSLCRAADPSASADPAEVRVQPALKKVTSLELPATAARLVRSASATDKEATALAVVRVVSKANAPALPSVVGAISRAQPALASKVVAEATRLQPKLSAQIRQAAALYIPISSETAAPSKPASGVSSGAGTGTAASIETLANDPIPTPGQGKKKGHYKNP